MQQGIATLEYGRIYSTKRRWALISNFPYTDPGSLIKTAAELLTFYCSFQ